MKENSQQAYLKSFRELIRLPLMFTNGGFTLLEILVVVLIIGILGAIALPQYQRAVLKSRFAALMPIAKSMADSNEAFYLEHGEYADNAEDLPIQGRRNYSDGTELEFGTLTGYSYVLATRDNDFPNNYVVYQKHSENYPGEIHCEADANNTQAQEVCKSFGPTQELGETLTSGYLTYVLFGTGNGEAPTGDEGGDTPSEPDDDDEPAGLDPAIQAKVNDFLASAECTGSNHCIDNGDGTISRCTPNQSTYDAENHKCLPSYEPGSAFDYEYVYNADGKLVEAYTCATTSTSGSECDARQTYTYDPATGNEVSSKFRRCQIDVVMDENWNCANGGTYWSGKDESYSPTIAGNTIAEYKCPANSDCSTYSSMTEWNDTLTQQRTCKDGKIEEHTCTEWNAWVNL